MNRLRTVTAMAPGTDRAWDRGDAAREPERPEPAPTPRDARWAALLDGLPDAFVEPRATPESIAALRRQLGTPPVDWPELADSDRVARRLRELEVEGHGPQRHEGQVTGQPHERPGIASRFDTPEAMVAADDAVRASDAFAAAEAIAREEGDGKLVARLSLNEALPEALRGQVTGLARTAVGDQVVAGPVDFTDGQVQGVYRWDDAAHAWSTYTVYPDRRRPSDDGREP